jgi:SAM-dependent methyltransferase
VHARAGWIRQNLQDAYTEEIMTITNDTDYKALIKARVLDDQGFVRATFSGRQRGHELAWQRVVLRPVLIKHERQIQFSYFDERQDTTKNYGPAESAAKLDDLLELGFRNFTVVNLDSTLQVNLSKKGRPLVHTAAAPAERPPPDLSHNRQKRLLLPADAPVPFLQAVGIQTREGAIKASMQAKFRQINEFLRLIEQAGVPQAAAGEPLRVVDLGCGNAYLTFATYHYLTETLGLPTEMVGVDLRANLLQKHAEVSRRLGWQGLSFTAAQIIDYAPAAPPDMVLALHACDTATDEALAQGIRWGSRLILSAPCCHHHLQEQLARQPVPEPLQPVARHGILRERLGDILTDSFRALILRIMGYQAEVFEFISTEHTAKNLMIRAVKSSRPGDQRLVEEYLALKRFWQVTPYLEELLGTELEEIANRKSSIA